LTPIAFILTPSGTGPEKGDSARAVAADALALGAADAAAADGAALFAAALGPGLAELVAAGCALEADGFAASEQAKRSGRDIVANVRIWIMGVALRRERESSFERGNLLDDGAAERR